MKRNPVIIILLLLTLAVQAPKASNHLQLVLEEFDGAHPPGQWDIHHYSHGDGSFPYEVRREGLVMTDKENKNQHLTRRGFLLDPKSQYALEATFQMKNDQKGFNSFCLNFQIAGEDGAFPPISCWSVNVDVRPGRADGAAERGGYSFNMGFLDGQFKAFPGPGANRQDWPKFDTDYTLRVEVNTDAIGHYKLGHVKITVTENGKTVHQRVADYSQHPYQPDLNKPVRVGVNSHGGNWTMRNFKVFSDRKPLLGGVWPGASAASPAAGRPKPIQALIVTGDNGKVHNWKETSAAIRDILRQDPQFEVSVEEEPASLAKRDISQFDVVILDFKDTKPVPDEDKVANNLVQFVKQGKGLVVIHWASAIFMKQQAIRDLVGRTQKRRHDKRGPFTVQIVNHDHPVTRGISDFQTDDELFFDLEGDRPIEILATAKSKVTGQDHPMAFVFRHGEGRVFHTPLGHDAKALSMPGTAELIRRGAAWVAGREAQIPVTQ